MSVVEADGQGVEPVTVDEFRFGVAETYDVIVTPKEDKAFTIAAESIDRTGFALGTLAPREGMKGAAPQPRPRALLTMADKVPLFIFAGIMLVLSGISRYLARNAPCPVDPAQAKTRSSEI
jgi:FtsP/CotA-like multicopper oxidase with cupredoxin domain